LLLSRSKWIILSGICCNIIMIMSRLMRTMMTTMTRMKEEL
jgi:hypothetical protein